MGRRVAGQTVIPQDIAVAPEFLDEGARCRHTLKPVRVNLPKPMLIPSVANMCLHFGSLNPLVGSRLRMSKTAKQEKFG